ncbi:helix-turn-helix domain-containing protein [Luteimonas sp. R10]|uniref:helix-turn-helix domain-containing protein n=1 Tax=Luteimonas sp. R10 TaxID=3108176 RepID=UPI0030924B32|nr:helix-turn-helix transcriptional regulator [Luteimonas sp. R10]
MHDTALGWAFCRNENNQGIRMAAPHEEFADRLRHMLDRADFVPGRGRTGALADRYAVSRETARKWLTGLALPELSRIIALAKDFNASLEWLATGRGHVQLRVGEASAVYRRVTGSEDRLLDAFRRLPEAKRKALVEFLS